MPHKKPELIYVVTFGRNHYESKHVYKTKSGAKRKAKSLRKMLPGLRFQVKTKVKR